MSKTLAEGLDLYKDRVSVLKKGFKQERYRISKICKHGLSNLYVDQITSVDIATYRDERLTSFNDKTGKIVSPATVRLELSLLSNFFDIAQIEWGLCGDNPVKKVRKPTSPPGRDRRLSLSEERKILSYAANYRNDELYAMISLAIETAMRQGEILNLRWDHIDLRKRVAKLAETKNGTKRDVPLSIKARDVLIRLEPKLSGQVFTYTSSGFKTTWSVMCSRLGIEDLHFHDLRHEAISRFFELGTMDLMEVAAISGHKSLSMLKRYTHLKAHKLVHKLEKKRGKGRLEIISAIVPFPAAYGTTEDNRIRITMLDLPELFAEADSYDKAMYDLRSKLLREIILRMRDGRRLPKPNEDVCVTNSDEVTIVIVDPLAID